MKDFIFWTDLPLTVIHALSAKHSLCLQCREKSRALIASFKARIRWLSSFPPWGSNFYLFIWDHIGQECFSLRDHCPQGGGRVPLPILACLCQDPRVPQVLDADCVYFLAWQSCSLQVHSNQVADFFQQKLSFPVRALGRQWSSLSICALRG